MRRKAQTRRIVDTITGQHLGLSVAAHLARTQIIAHPSAVYDTRHVVEMLDVIGSALVRVAHICVLDTKTGERRELLSEELEGAKARSAGTLLELKDGRTLSGVSIKREDLRQAIAILKTVGIPEFGEAPSEEHAKETMPMLGGIERLREQLAEMEELLDPPLRPAQAQLANKLATAVARHAPRGDIANLAMQLVSAVQDALKDGNEQKVSTVLACLRTAFDQLVEKHTR